MGREKVNKSKNSIKLQKAKEQSNQKGGNSFGNKNTANHPANRG